MKLPLILSRREFIDNLTGILLNKNWAIISISDSEHRTILVESDNILNLVFHDIEDVRPDDVWPNWIKIITDEQIEQIHSFIEKNKNCERFVVHCEAGISRSAAVAKYIVNRFNLDYNEFTKKYHYILPNQLVLKLLTNKRKTRFYQQKSKSCLRFLYR